MQTTLVEAGRIGDGASGASGALIRAFDPEPALEHLVLRGMRRYAARGWRGTWPAVREVGSLLLLDEPALAARSARAAALSRAGHPVVVLDRAALRRRAPGIDLAGLAGAIYEPRAGWVPARAVLAAMLADGRAAGVRVLEQTRVVGVEVDADGVRAVRTDAAQLPADVVVVAAGASSAGLLDALGIALDLRVKQVGYVLLDPGPAVAAALPTVVDGPSGAWARPWGDGRVLVGAPIEAWDAPTQVRALPADEEDVEHRRVRAAIAHRLPWVATARAAGGVVAYDAFSSAGYGEVTARAAVPGLITATAWSGGGFKSAPAAGERAAALACAALRTRSVASGWRCLGVGVPLTKLSPGAE